MACRISSKFYYLFCDFQTLGSNLNLGSRHEGSKYQWKESRYTKDNLSYTYSNVRKITGCFATNDACQIQTIFCLLCLVDQHHHQRCITFVKHNSLKDPLTLVGHALSFVQTLGHEHKCLKSMIYLLHKLAFHIISNVCLQTNSLSHFEMIIFLPCSHENTWTAYCWAVQSWMSQSFGHLIPFTILYLSQYLEVLAMTLYFKFHLFPHLLVFFTVLRPLLCTKLIHQSSPAEMTYSVQENQIFALWIHFSPVMNKFRKVFLEINHVNLDF